MGENMPNDVYSIFFDMLNVPINMDINKLFIEHIKKSVQKDSIFLIRILKNSEMLSKINGAILKEKELYLNIVTLHNHINNRNFDFLEFLSKKWPKITRNKTLLINKYIFITSNYVNAAEELDEKSKIYIVTNSEIAEKYNKPNIEVINYDNYMINDIKAVKKEINEYDEFNWHNIGTGNSVINKRVFWQIKKIIEALNEDNKDYVCLKYERDIDGTNWKAFENRYIEQYNLLFEYL
jgi:hypothetical protein